MAHIASSSVAVLHTDVSAVNVPAAPGPSAVSLGSHIYAQLLQHCPIL